MSDLPRLLAFGGKLVNLELQDMEPTYGCCKNKALSSFCCIVCHDVFHHSCLERRKNVVRLLGHKIYCSSRCQEKHLDEEKRIEDFVEDVRRLREEVEGRDQYIERLKRSSRDFEDEVLATEEKYVGKFKELGDVIQRRNQELEDLKKRIVDLEGEMNAISERNSILKSDLENLNGVNQQMVTTIGTLEMESEGYCREAKLLRVELDHCKSHGCRVNCGSGSRGAVFRHVTAPVQDGRPKLLLVAGGFGRDLVHFLGEQCRHTYQLQAVLKPNSSNSELVDTALKNSKHFTKEDVVMIWPFNLSTDLIDKFLMKTSHTNGLILTRPYGHRISDNNFIYESNLSLYKQIHNRKLNLASVFDSNSALCGGDRVSCYTKRGKWLLARALWRHVSVRLVAKSGGSFPGEFLLDQNVSVGDGKANGVNVHDSDDRALRLTEDGTPQGSSSVQKGGCFFRPQQSNKTSIPAGV